MGELLGIFTAPDAGAPMERVDLIDAIAGEGLEGDRYATSSGAWSRAKPPKVRHVTLIAQEAIDAANASCDSEPFAPEDTRRNLLVRGLDLNGLVDRTFSIGSVLMLGTELCDPCQRPSKLCGKPGFAEAFDGRGGLRAEILQGGPMIVGDRVVINPTP